MIICFNIRRWYCELFFNGDDFVVDTEWFEQFSIRVILVHVFDQIVNHSDFRIKVVLRIMKLQFLETLICIDLMRQMVDLTHFRRFDLKLIILTFAYYNGLNIMFYILLLIIRELFFKTIILIINNFMLMVNLIIFVTILFISLILTDN